jgi:hypothetical protein
MADSNRGGRRFFLYAIIVIAVLSVWLVSLLIHSRTRTLVFIVPGTSNDDGLWPNVFEGKSTFGSELCRGLGSQCNSGGIAGMSQYRRACWGRGHGDRCPSGSLLSFR